MVAGVGLAAFVEGYYGARDRQRSIANEKEDRARQKKLDEITFAREKRAAEEHDLRMGEARRAIADREAERQMFADAYGATKEAMDGDPARGGRGAVPVSPDPVTGVAAELGLPLGAVTNGAADTYVANNPLPATPGVARPGPTVAAAAALPRQVRASQYPPGRGPASQPAAAPRPPMGAVPPDNRGIAPGAELQRFGPSDRGSGMIAPELYEMGAIGRRYSGGTPGPIRQDEGAAPDTRSPGQWAADVAAPIRQGIVDAIDGYAGITVAPRQAGLSVLQKGAGYAAGFAGFPEAADKMIGAGRESMDSAIANLTGGKPSRAPGGQVEAPSSTPVPETVTAANAGPRVSTLPPDEQKADKQARAAMGAARVVEQTASPETQGAAQAAVEAAANPVQGKGGKGLKPGEAVTPAQKERASKAFMDYYAENGVPKIIEGYLKRGEIDKAMAFQTFMDSQTTKAAMKEWALATFALTTGDLDGFADRLMDAYNRNDYINDDTVVLKDQSEIFRDSQGNITGARIVFKDQKSGHTFDQVFSGPDDLIAFGMMNFDPANVFEMYQARNEAAKANAKGALDTAKTAAEIEKLQADADKARAEAASTRAIGGLGAAPAAPTEGGPPVVYRP